MQLHDDVDAHVRERPDDVFAHHVEGRIRRPGRRVQHSGGRRIEADRRLDRPPIERAVNEAVDLRVSDQLALRRVGVDEAGLGVAAEPIAVREQQAIEGRNDRGDVKEKKDGASPFCRA